MASDRPIKKSKVVPRQAEVALGVPGRLRPRIMSTFGTTRVVGRQPYALAAITPGEIRGIARAESDGTRAETRFRLSLKRTSPFKSVGVSVQSTAGSRGVRISLSNAG